MSIDIPNQFEKAIEDYAMAVREERNVVAQLERWARELDRTKNDRQSAWRQVSEFVNTGHIKPGIYRLKTGNTPFAEGILIVPSSDYPDIFPMYR